jgi:EAL domain-containing protein (putative c-di-GMP-specific phosphodiesterase class I)/GGDEF domain-containing protein
MTTSRVQDRDYSRLRADWLRLKNQVFDANAELPTLAAVLDDVRRLVEDRGTIGLLYLDLAGDIQGEAVHGWIAYDEVLRGFARALAGLRRDGLVTLRDTIAVISVRSDKFLLFLGGPGPGVLDEDSLSTLAAHLRERIVETLPRHLSNRAMAPLTFHHGHSLLQRDPMLRSERAIHRALDHAMLMSLHRRTRDEDRRAHDLDRLIRDGNIESLYQPIMDLRDLTVLGHEVFSRGPAGSSFEDAEGLFALAERTGRLLDFERLCRNRALTSARRHLGPGLRLFLNTSAQALLDPDLAAETFARQVGEQGLEPRHVVLEITERVAVEERAACSVVLRNLKRCGFGVAIDDMGAGYSSLHSVVEMEPDFTKFDVSLVRHIDRSLIKRSLLETLVELSEKIGARVIAEGIEAESELATLRDLGVGLGQGRYLAPPLPVPAGGMVHS